MADFLSQTRGSFDKPPNHDRVVVDDTEYTCSVIDATEGIAVGDKRKRSLLRERDDDAVEIVGGGGDDHHHHHPMPAAKKPRFVWTNEHHQQFLNAVSQLGNKAVPKKILELMNMPGLTRENVASHLQKFRLYEKSKATQEQNGILNGTVQPNNKLGSSTRFSMQSLANADASRHVSPQAQAHVGFHVAGNTWSISENHYSLSSHQAAYGGTYTAPKYDSNNNNNIPYPYYYHNDELMNFLAMHMHPQQHHQHQQIMMQHHHIHQNLPYYEHDFNSDSFSNNNNIQPSSYIMAPPSQSQPYDETFQGGISSASDVNYYNNNNNYYYSSSSLSNIAELHAYANPQVLASHPTLSPIAQQQQLHNGAVRQFYGVSYVSDALDDVDTMKEVPNAINSEDVDHPI